MCEWGEKMRKIALLLCSALCMLNLQAGAAQEPQGQAEKVNAVTVAKEEPASLTPAEVAEQLPKENYLETISYADMQACLQKGIPENKLYLKVGEEIVLVYQNLAKDRAACAQIVCGTPKDYIINCYTNNKDVSSTMYKALKDRNNGLLSGGYRIVGAKSPTTQVENKGKIYKFWYEKLKYNGYKVRSRGFSLPIGIGIGIPVGGGHHRPHIGIGL